MLTDNWQKSTFSNPSGNCVECRKSGPDEVQMRDSKEPAGPVLTFTRAEWDAFLGGAEDGEFDIPA